MARPRTAEPVEVNFEQAMSELDEIVRELEEGGLPLEGLVEKYERGAGLLRICQAKLNAAQQRIEMISRSADGPPVVEPFTREAAPAAAVAPTVQRSSGKVSSPEHANTDEIRLF